MSGFTHSNGFPSVYQFLQRTSGVLQDLAGSWDFLGNYVWIRSNKSHTNFILHHKHSATLASSNSAALSHVTAHWVLYSKYCSTEKRYTYLHVPALHAATFKRYASMTCSLFTPSGATRSTHSQAFFSNKALGAMTWDRSSKLQPAKHQKMILVLPHSTNNAASGQLYLTCLLALPWCTRTHTKVETDKSLLSCMHAVLMESKSLPNDKVIINFGGNARKDHIRTFEYSQFMRKMPYFAWSAQHIFELRCAPDDVTYHDWCRLQDLFCQQCHCVAVCNSLMCGMSRPLQVAVYYSTVSVSLTYCAQTWPSWRGSWQILASRRSGCSNGRWLVWLWSIGHGGWQID